MKYVANLTNIIRQHLDGQLPAHIKVRYSVETLDDDAALRKRKGKGKEGEQEMELAKQTEASRLNSLSTLDIFAGCGGLSEGLQQSGNFQPLTKILLSHLLDLHSSCWQFVP